jgi:putative transposase
MPRKARIVVPGFLHHVTQRGNFRSDVFFDDEDREFFLDILVTYAAKADVQIVSYCLMTNHTHLLLIPREEKGLSRALKPVHMRYSQYLNCKFKRFGLNWQGRFFSSAMDKAHAANAIRYVADNPQRAKLVDRVEDYRWSSARDHLLNERSSILTADDTWLTTAHKILAMRIEPHNLDPEWIQQIRRNTFLNLPTGSPEFISELERRFDRDLQARDPGRPRKG